MLGRRRSKSVATGSNGDDYLWILRISLQLGAEALDEGAQVVALVAVARPPHRPQERSMVPELTRVFGECGEQPVLGGRQTNLVSVSQHGLAAEVDADVAGANDVRLLRA